MTRRPGPGAYARALEAALSRARGRPVLLSPRDWALASDWYGRQIPVAVVLEVIEEAARRGRKRSTLPAGPRSLAYVAAAVEESWQEIQRGRVGAHPPSGTKEPSLAQVRKRWEEVLASTPRESSLGELLSDLLDDLSSGSSPLAVDRKLDEALPECAPGDLLAGSRKEVAEELDPFRERMARKTYEATFRRAVVERLRRLLGLPHLP